VEFGFGVEARVELHDVGVGAFGVGSTGGPTCGGVEPYPSSRDLAINGCAAGSRDFSDGADREAFHAAQFCTSMSTVNQTP